MEFGSPSLEVQLLNGELNFTLVFIGNYDGLALLAVIELFVCLPIIGVARSDLPSIMCIHCPGSH